MRCLLAGASGAVAGGVLGWRAGCAAVAIALAVHTIYLHNRPGQLRNWRLGALAERRTARLLAALDPTAFRVLHDRVLPGVPSANLDHLVIGLTGAYVIASRRWTWGVRLWSDRHRLWVGSRPIVHLPSAAARAADAVSERLAVELDRSVRVFPLVAVHGARAPRGGLRHRGVMFQRARRVPRFLHQQPVVFTTAQITEIAIAADRAFPPMLLMIDGRAAERRTIA
jgi:nuclease-like protein